MRIRIWGARGSLPIAMDAKTLQDKLVAALLAANRKALDYHFVISHMHWDHIMGFPLFTPIYMPGNRVIVYGCHEQLEAAFRR